MNWLHREGGHHFHGWFFKSQHFHNVRTSLSFENFVLASGPSFCDSIGKCDECIVVNEWIVEIQVVSIDEESKAEEAYGKEETELAHFLFLFWKIDKCQRRHIKNVASLS